MTPKTAIHAFCVECVGGSSYEVKNCGGDKCLQEGGHKDGVCLFYKYRMGEGRPSVKLIRQYCLFCQGDRQDFVKECADECALHPYRMGRNPARSGMGNISNLKA